MGPCTTSAGLPSQSVQSVETLYPTSSQTSPNSGHQDGFDSGNVGNAHPISLPPKTDAAVTIAAISAISILARAGVPLHGADLQGVNILEPIFPPVSSIVLNYKRLTWEASTSRGVVASGRYERRTDGRRPIRRAALYQVG
jgi:hypothetical protein